MFTTNDFILWQRLADGRKMPACALSGDSSGYLKRGNGVAYDTARGLAAIHGEQFRVGFVFHESAPYWFLDIDHCVLDGGIYNAIAQELLKTLEGCAVERSQSGDGLHIFGRYEGEIPAHSCKNTALGIEFYHADRFVALTEDWIAPEGGVETIPAPGVLESVISRFFKPSERETSAVWSDEPREGFDGPTDDVALLRAAKSAKSAGAVFGGAASFRDLYECNEEALAVSYPVQNDRDDFDKSSADGALAMHLLWWTGQDHERALRLMEQSELRRDKWDREDYLPRTILSASTTLGDSYYSKGNAVAKAAEVATAERVAKPVDVRGMVPQQFVAPNIIDVAGQCALFGGLVAIASRGTVFDPSKGLHMTKDAFNMRYGNAQYVIDTTGKLTAEAWAAFFRNPLVRYPASDFEGFDPNKPAGEIYHDERGASFFNTYAPAVIEENPGDVSVFHTFLDKLLPVERDREILLAWMAYVVRNPGKKVLWSPVIQGVPGNGKTTLARIMRHAVSPRYSRVLNDATLGEPHNGWMMGALFVQMDELLITGRGKESKVKKLNAYLTDETFGLRRMNKDIIDCPNYANFMFTTNYRDSIPKAAGERRFAVMFTGQQDDGDRARDGLTVEYFSRTLYPWLTSGGYGALANYLRHDYVEHPEFYGATNVPRTSSEAAAISESRGEVADAIQFIIDTDGATGVNDTFISLTAVRERLNVNRVRYNDRTLSWALKEMGYHKHRGVDRGRIHVIADDHMWDVAQSAKVGRVTLYVRSGAPEEHVVGEENVRRAYLTSCRENVQDNANAPAM